MFPAPPNLNSTLPEDGSLAAAEPVTVLVNLPLDADLVDRIASVDPHVRVVPILVNSDPASTLADVDQWKLFGDAELEPLLAEASVLFTFRFPPEWLPKAPNLDWVQLASAGVDFLIREGTLAGYPQIAVTTSSGIHEVPISEHILAMMLHFSRGLNKSVRNQATHTWDRYRADELQGKTVLFIGYGPIARRAAMLCRALGMRVLCVRASLTEEQPGDGEQIERFYPLAGLDAALSLSDYTIVAAPHTPRSEGMVGRAQFDAMRPGAVLVNISRGALVDEGAMIDALREGTLAGAGLDVFAQEPLPSDSPLWDMPHVLITPHISGSNPHYNSRATDLFCDNLARYLAGAPLRNHVNMERGY